MIYIAQRRRTKQISKLQDRYFKYRGKKIVYNSKGIDFLCILSRLIYTPAQVHLSYCSTFVLMLFISKLIWCSGLIISYKLKEKSVRKMNAKNNNKRFSSKQPSSLLSLWRYTFLFWIFKLHASKFAHIFA